MYIVKSVGKDKRVRIYPKTDTSKVNGQVTEMEIETIRIKGRIEEKTDVYVRVKDLPEEFIYMLEESEIYHAIAKHGIEKNVLCCDFEVVQYGRRIRILVRGSDEHRAYVKQQERLKTNEYIVKGAYYHLYLSEGKVENALYLGESYGLRLFRTEDRHYYVVSELEDIEKVPNQHKVVSDIVTIFYQDLEAGLMYLEKVKAGVEKGIGVTREEARRYQQQVRAYEWVGRMYPTLWEYFKREKEYRGI